jgi:Icc-related predicted phosphoesterase
LGDEERGHLASHEEGTVRAGVITDIHANLPALQATLAALEAIGVDALYCGGDLVGYRPSPNEVCALVGDRAIPTI